jgi:DNA-binding transcriptional LysR family regulator
MKELNFRTLDLNLLRVFDEVMTERNLTRAAHNLSTTQPAVSNAMRRLRDWVGDDLVRRSGYGVEPTATALQLWPTVREALHQLRDSLAPGRFDAAQAQNHFVLAMADATVAQLVPRLIDIVSAEAPRITLRVLPLTSRDPRSALDDGSVDLAIGHFPGVMAEIHANHLQESVPRYRSLRLYDTRYVAVLRKGHPLAVGELTLDAFCNARHLLVSFSGRPYGFVDEALAQVSRSRRVVLAVNQFFAAAQVVAQTDLITVLPAHFLAGSGRSSELVQRPLPFHVPPVQVDMLWHRQAQTNEAQQWMREAIVRSVRVHEDPAPQ